jgi:4-aminobutyrate aminotransferase/(S)-3-amino-2-methylpropionate transaminase
MIKKSIKTKKLFQKLRRLVPRGIGKPLPFFVKSAKGAIITDIEGREFIDFTSGISAVNLGHANKKVVQAIRAQAKKFLHTFFPNAPYELYLQVAEKLIKLTPGKFPKKVFFANSGAEAVENAIKIARRATGRPAIVSFTHGFHGRTLLTLSLTSKVKPYKFGFGPFAPEIYHLEYPYSYRRPAHCQTEDEYVDYLLRQIEEEFFTGVVDPEHIAAIIIEPVAGEGGFIVAPRRYLQGLAKICKKYKILFIADEVQTGFGRTGKWFACEHSGIAPDLLVCAKSIASGMPLSAVIGRREIMDSVQPGGLGGTFGGNPVCLAAALATIEELKRLNLPALAREIGERIEKVFRLLGRECPRVGETRGLGAMWALEMVKNKKTKEPDAKLTKQLIRKMFDSNVLVLSAGILGNDLRILPPLTISSKDLDKGLSLLTLNLRTRV